MSITITPGTSYTGVYAPDGSLNVVINPAGVGVYHPSGALNVTLSSGQSAVNAAVYNLTTANSAKLKSTLTAGLRNGYVSFQGSSVMRGVDEKALPYNSQYTLSMPHVVAKMLVSSGQNAGCNNWFGFSGTNLNDYLIRDSRVAATGSTALGGSAIQGGNSCAMTAAGTFSFTPPGVCTKADIYWRDSSTLGRTFSWAVDGGAATNITTTGGTSIAKTTISLGAATAHTILLSWVAGSVDIYGIDCYDDTAGRTEITCWQQGTSGGSAATMVGNSGAPNAGRLQQITSYPPDLIICEGGLPNSWRQSISVASVTTDLTTLVTTAQAAGSDFMFITPPFDGSSTGLTANQNAYVQAMYNVATTKNVPVIDIRRTWLSYANQITTCRLSTGDSVHPSVLYGYPDMASIVFAVIKQITA